MKYIQLSIIIAYVFMHVEISAADLRIAEYPGARSAAMSMTFDDGFRSQGAEHLRLLKPYDFKGTFFIVVGQVKDNKPPKEWGNRMSWQLLREMHTAGHEIANHSWSHLALKKGVATDVLEKEVNYAANVFQDKMGFAPHSFAFPGGSRHKEVPGLAEQHHPCVRKRVLTYGGDRWTTAKANAWVDQAIADGTWIVPMIHGIKGGWSHFRSPDEFDAHLKYVFSRKDAIWVAPMAEVSKYTIARKAARLSGTVKKTSAQFTCTFSGIDNELYGVPLTVCLPEPKKVEKIMALQGGERIPAYIMNGMLCVDVVPSEQPEKVSVSW